MNVYCIVMFEFNYSVEDIRNSDLGEGIICSGEGSGGKGGREVGEKGEGSGGKGGGKWGNAYPPVHPLCFEKCFQDHGKTAVRTNLNRKILKNKNRILIILIERYSTFCPSIRTLLSYVYFSCRKM